MQPELRTLANELLLRFAESREAPMSIAQEGAALALWGTQKAEAFLEWHREQGGLARSLEVLLAAIAYDRRTYEWDSSIWALARARPSVGLGNLGTAPWLWLRRELDDAQPAERTAAREIAGRASRAWHVRAALAFAFPTDTQLWMAGDDAELRQADIMDPPTIRFGMLAAMRTEERRERGERNDQTEVATGDAALLAEQYGRQRAEADAEQREQAERLDRQAAGADLDIGKRHRDQCSG